VNAAQSRAPRVSVVMTVYNDLRFLDAAVESVLVQDLKDFELIIVDDGTHQSAVMERLAGRDPRICLIVNAENVGAAAAANRGIERARADIIARLDADDIAEPTRIRRLLSALDDDPQLGLVGTWFTTMTENGEPSETIRLPTTDLEIRWCFLFSNPFCHSSVAFRRLCFDAVGGYRPELRVLEDYDLWSRILTACRAGNIPEPLTRYRLNTKGLTATRGADLALMDAVRERYWKELGVPFDRGVARHIATLVAGYDILPKEGRPEAFAVILRLLYRFLGAPRRIERREEDGAVARRLVRETIARIQSQQSMIFAILMETWRLTGRAYLFPAAIGLLQGIARRCRNGLGGRAQ
jgi:glycosyltransferase involved in cell wall biosynthesis